MSKKRIVGIICLVSVLLLFVGGFVCYAKFLLAHRSMVIIVCVCAIIAIMWIQCARACGQTTKRIDSLVSELTQKNTLQNNTNSQPNKN